MGLERFKKAQEDTYDTALREIKSGRKTGHWMWYIFPQIAGLGMTETSRYYAIKDIKEASDFLMDQQLGFRLSQICEALLQLDNSDAQDILGRPDDLKLRSSMTLFDAVPATFPVFAQVLDKFYNGERDARTLQLLKAARDD